MSELPLAGDKPRFRMSPSRLRTYMEDPARYYFKYIMGLKEQASLKMRKGSTIHKGIEFALKAKQSTESLPKLTDTIGYLGQYLKDNFAQSDFDEGWLEENIEYYMMLFRDFIYPELNNINPKFIEKYISHSINNQNYDLIGYIDCVHTSGKISDKFNSQTDKIIDFKTKSKSPSSNEEGKYRLENFDKVQLTAYALCCVEEKDEPVEVEAVYIVTTQTPKLIKVQETITPVEMKNRLKTITNIVEQIEAGNFFPNYGHWNCSPGKCAFYQQCHETL